MPAILWGGCLRQRGRWTSHTFHGNPPTFHALEQVPSPSYVKKAYPPGNDHISHPWDSGKSSTQNCRMGWDGMWSFPGGYKTNSVSWIFLWGPEFKGWQFCSGHYPCIIKTWACFREKLQAACPMTLSRTTRMTRIPKPKKNWRIFHGYHLTGGTYQDFQQKTQGFFPKGKNKVQLILSQKMVSCHKIWQSKDDAIFSPLRDVT